MILLVRYKKGLVGESRRVVHLIDVAELRVDEARAFCGQVFGKGEVERLDGVQGMPCVACLKEQAKKVPPEISDTFLR